MFAMILNRAPQANKEQKLQLVGTTVLSLIGCALVLVAYGLTPLGFVLCAAHLTAMMWRLTLICSCIRPSGQSVTECVA